MGGGEEGSPTSLSPWCCFGARWGRREGRESGVRGKAIFFGGGRSMHGGGLPCTQLHPKRRFGVPPLGTAMLGGVSRSRGGANSWTLPPLPKYTPKPAGLAPERGGSHWGPRFGAKNS